MTTQSINQVKPLFCLGSMIGKSKYDGGWAAGRHFVVVVFRPSSLRRLGLGSYQSQSFGKGPALSRGISNKWVEPVAARSTVLFISHS